MSSLFRLTQVQLTIIDENDCPPHFNKSSYHLNVKDGSSGGTYIDLVTASDLDSPTVNKETELF